MRQVSSGDQQARELFSVTLRKANKTALLHQKRALLIEKAQRNSESTSLASGAQLDQTLF